MAFSPDGKRLASASLDGVKSWDARPLSIAAIEEMATAVPKEVDDRAIDKLPPVAEPKTVTSPPESIPHFTQDELDAFEKNLLADPNYQWQILRGDHRRTVALILAAQINKPALFGSMVRNSPDALNSDPKSWNYGNTIYTANEILGRVALRQDDIEGARSFLLASGKMPGSPQLNSFGPAFILDREMLEKGKSPSFWHTWSLSENFGAIPTEWTNSA